jgi:hypothetical protein
MRCTSCGRRFWLRRSSVTWAFYDDSFDDDDYDPPGWFLLAGVMGLVAVPVGVALSVMWSIAVGISVVAIGTVTMWFAYFAVREAMKNQRDWRASTCPGCGTANDVRPWSF